MKEDRSGGRNGDRRAATKFRLMLPELDYDRRTFNMVRRVCVLCAVCVLCVCCVSCYSRMCARVCGVCCMGCAAPQHSAPLHSRLQKEAAIAKLYVEIYNLDKTQTPVRQQVVFVCVRVRACVRVFVRDVCENGRCHVSGSAKQQEQQREQREEQHQQAAPAAPASSSSSIACTASSAYSSAMINRGAANDDRTPRPC